ncbi:MAG: excisionase family DNA-binding protein, partial [Isosphaeraceae bacterium]
MARPDDHLKTRMVAKALGLSVSTIKRWVDSGTIHAVRTAGRHRLIPRTEAIRMACELGRDGTEIRKIAPGARQLVRRFRDQAALRTGSG